MPLLMKDGLHICFARVVSEVMKERQNPIFQSVIREDLKLYIAVFTGRVSFGGHPLTVHG